MSNKNIDFFKVKQDRFAHGRSFLKIDGIDSLSSIVEKDWPWSNRSRLSLKKTMSESIPSIDGSDSIFFMIKSIFWSQKTIDSIEKPMIEFPTLNLPEPNFMSWGPLPTPLILPESLGQLASAAARRPEHPGGTQVAGSRGYLRKTWRRKYEMLRIQIN